MDPQAPTYLSNLHSTEYCVQCMYSNQTNPMEENASTHTGRFLTLFWWSTLDISTDPVRLLPETPDPPLTWWPKVSRQAFDYRGISRLWRSGRPKLSQWARMAWAITLLSPITRWNYTRPEAFPGRRSQERTWCRLNFSIIPVLSPILTECYSSSSSILCLNGNDD